MTLNELKNIDILKFDIDRMTEHKDLILQLSEEDIYDYLVWVIDTYEIEIHNNLVDLFKFPEFHEVLERIMDNNF
jgi:hypothetical protein